MWVKNWFCENEGRMDYVLCIRIHLEHWQSASKAYKQEYQKAQERETGSSHSILISIFLLILKWLWIFAKNVWTDHHTAEKEFFQISILYSGTKCLSLFFFHCCVCFCVWEGYTYHVSVCMHVHLWTQVQLQASYSLSFFLFLFLGLHKYFSCYLI